MVKKAKLQTHKRPFESLKMKDKENVAVYLLHVDEIFNTVRGLGENVEEPQYCPKCAKVTPLKI